MVFIWPAFADGGQPSNGMISFLLPIAMIGALYFLLIRPKQKLDKQHKELLATIRKGDKVITNCGMKATVSKIVNDHEVILEIASNVHCKFMKSAIARLNSGIPEAPAVNEPSKEQITQPVLPGGNVPRKIGAATLKATKAAPTKGQEPTKSINISTKTKTVGRKAAAEAPGKGKKSPKQVAKRTARSTTKSIGRPVKVSKVTRKTKRSPKSRVTKK